MAAAVAGNALHIFIFYFLSLFHHSEQASVEKGIVQKYGLSKRLVPVEKCRDVTKADMVLNDLCPKITGERHQGFFSLGKLGRLYRSSGLASVHFSTIRCIFSYPTRGNAVK